MAEIRTHYDNLQVKETASEEVIKGAYRYLSQKWHPDRNAQNRDEAERVLKIINRAYSVLSDPLRRKEHDEWIRRQRPDVKPPNENSSPPPPPPSSEDQDEQRANTAVPPDPEKDEPTNLFVGNKYEYYRRKWDTADHDERNTSWNWNWAAFFLGLGWIAYRKMYLYSFIYIAGMIVAMLIEYVLNVSVGVSNAVNLAVAMTVGSQGNIWYRHHAEKKAKEIQASHAPDAVTRELQSQGGTSIVAAMGFVILHFSVIALVIVIAMTDPPV